MDTKALKDRLLARLFTRFPALFHRWVKSHRFVEFDSAPWTPFKGPLTRSRLALVTTAGVHQATDRAFDMRDPAGDPSFRLIPADAAPEDLTITHNYYDHADADRDINVVLPLEPLRDLARSGEIGGVATHHIAFMGHILPPHLHTLMHRTAPEAARRLRQEGVDAVILTPA